MPMNILKDIAIARFLFALQTFVLALIMSLGAWYMVVHQRRARDTQVFETVQMMSMFGAKAISRIFEEAVDNGVFAVSDIMDTNYNIIEGIDPPKYHTKYDFYTDKALTGLQDELLKDENVKYAFAIDINGYIPTHNIRFQKPITYNYEYDERGNKTKQIHNDPLSHNISRNLKEGYRQIFFQNEGEEMWDVATPIHVKGRHWGNFRVGYSLAGYSRSMESLTLYLIILMTVIWGFSVLFLYLAFRLPLREGLKAQGTY